MYTQEEIDDFSFFKDSLFDEIYNKLKKSRYIAEPYEKAKSIRVSLSKNIFLDAYDIDKAQQLSSLHDDLYNNMSNYFKISFKNLYKANIEKLSRNIYKDRLLDIFLDSYIEHADRFNNYEIYQLHISYGHAYVIKKFEAQKLKKKYTKISFDDFVKYIKNKGIEINVTLDFKKSNYDGTFDLSCDDLFEMLFHRISVICWMREIKSNEAAFKGKELLLLNKLTDISTFFYEMISAPLSARYLRLKDIPYWYQNPMGADKTKDIDRLLDQPHVFCYKFATDFMNNFFKHEIKASEANKEKYPELFESDGIKPSILHQGGSFLDGNFIFILDILLLSEFFGFDVSSKSIAEELKWHNYTNKAINLIREVKKRFCSDYIMKLGSLYKYEEFNKKSHDVTAE
ncbi:hypothetical protein [Francisella philomiragia]|uniref:hypothetical protein n=1 Tax=Francisella philomiragia TaxID=28110 RepID=UPI00190654AC|nr:hypothetical protein [Francisella philomiragia]MBK2266516.1 hypothetical protein [Francisella philomiragia]MBK2278316.1 hypothetical protein [Francisella philomiragia]MBK2286172.1 hypothetical protein [Francisella philomiragia]MBK2287799.1 hypothetical protein [Francisella philomiragia]MBK2290131.1 hypothetical protein [Francisella philomiragia]